MFFKINEALSAIANNIQYLEAVYPYSMLQVCKSEITVTIFTDL